MSQEQKGRPGLPKAQPRCAHLAESQTHSVLTLLPTTRNAVTAPPPPTHVPSEGLRRGDLPARDELASVPSPGTSPRGPS